LAIRPTVILAAAGIILCAVVLQKATPQSLPLTDPPVTTFETTRNNEQLQHATGNPNECQAGCSTSSHPIDPLTRPEYLHLLDTFTNGNGESRASALETLLFYGHHVRDWIDGADGQRLSDEDESFLCDELAKTHVRLWMRLVDGKGIVRAKVDGVRVPIGSKSHVHMTDTHDLQAPEVSGTVYRTGLHHLWTRI